MKILGIFGNVLLFSSFERAQIRPKLYAMKIKYEGQNQFVTIAPPEHDDIILLKINKIREEKIYNTNDFGLSNENQNINTWLSEDLINSAQKRIAVAQ